MTHGERRDGTTRFHAYATAYVIVQGQRFTLALTFVWADDRLMEVLQRLRKRLRQMGVKTKLLLLDRQFVTVEIINRLQRDGQPLIIPVILQGKLEPPGGTRVLVVKRSSQWTRYTMKSASGRTVTFEVAVAAQNGAAHRSRSGQSWKRGRHVRAYAVCGLRAHPLAIAQVYRRRFGIESSYRQMHQGRACTSSPRAVFRLWLVGLALLLRTLWIWIRFTAAALCESRPPPPEERPLHLSVAVALDGSVSQRTLRSDLPIAGLSPSAKGINGGGLIPMPDYGLLRLG